MPLPTPNKGEKEKDFVSRCMGSDVMKKEFPDQKQRAAVCYKQFRGKNEDFEEPTEIKGQSSEVITVGRDDTREPNPFYEKISKILK
jgi:hypothetical protein